MKLALYTRVSTDAQDATNQVLELKAWADRQGHPVVAEYQDIMTGARRREHLDDLFDAARRRKFDLVAIWSLDRFTREGPLQTLLYLQRLTAMGVRVYSHQETCLDPALPFYESIVAFLQTWPGGSGPGYRSVPGRAWRGPGRKGRYLAGPRERRTVEKGGCGGVAGWVYLYQWADKRTYLQKHDATDIIAEQ